MRITTWLSTNLIDVLTNAAKNPTTIHGQRFDAMACCGQRRRKMPKLAREVLMQEEYVQSAGCGSVGGKVGKALPCQSQYRSKQGDPVNQV